jgi:adenine-specific DNA methylase
LARLVAGLNAEGGMQNDEFGAAVQTCLALAVDKQADLGNALCRWEPVAQCPRQLFGRQAIGMVWDFAEGVASGESSGAWSIQADRMAYVLEGIGSNWFPGHIEFASATAHPLPNDAVQAVITDPPYYDAVPYAYLSDFFYVWLRRTLGHVHPDLFNAAAVPKDEEIVVDRPHELSNSTKDITFYERELTRAFAESRRILHPAGIGTIVFASKTTASWEAILQAVVEAGWIITGSWPIDTEMSTRIAAQGQARLASSVHLVCRPRNDERGTMNDERGTMNDESKTDSSFITHHSSLVGDWRDVLQELPQRIHAWLPRLAREGVVGADAIFACLGPALEIFSRYSRVEKASGEQVLLKEYLEQVWAAVSKEALSMVFAGADATGFEEDARLAAMWLWTLNTNDELRMMNDEGNDESGMMNDESDSSFIVHHSTFALEYDAARKIAQGLGAHLERLGSLVEVKGETARLLPVSARAGYLFGKDSQVSQAPARPKKRSAQLSLFETTAEGGEQNDEYRMMNDEFDSSFIVHHSSFTILDRVHQSMLLFAAGRSDALKRFLVDEGVGQNTRFWQLANALSALYPPGTDEKRWVEGVLARKKGLGF